MHSFINIFVFIAVMIMPHNLERNVNILNEIQFSMLIIKYENQ